MPNIKAISKLSGVSVATVSRVLNNHPYVKDETKNKVLVAIEQLKYTRNSSAVNLRKGQTFVIGVVVPFIEHPFFSVLIQGIGEATLPYNYEVLLLQRGEEEARELDYLNLLKTKRVDGLILGSSITEWEVLKKFTEYGPIIACEKIKDANISSIYINHYKGAYEGVKFLHECGYKKIAICPGPRYSPVALDRLRGFKDAMKDFGLTTCEEWIFMKNHSIELGKQIFSFIKDAQNKPDAIVAGSDEVAAGIIKASQKQGIELSKDLGILGFDNQNIAELFEITTFEQPIKDIGKKAVELLIGQINKTSIEVKEIELPFKLVQRGSAKCRVD